MTVPWRRRQQERETRFYQCEYCAEPVVNMVDSPYESGNICQTCFHETEDIMDDYLYDLRRFNDYIDRLTS